MKDKYTKRMVVSSSDMGSPNQVPEFVALINEDGSPFIEGLASSLSGQFAAPGIADIAGFGYRSGWYVVAGTPGNSAAIPGEGVLNVVPFVISTPRVFDRISALVTIAGSAGAVVRLGIYGSDSGEQPAGLILDAGTVDATVTGVRAITINQTLNVGVYWLGAVVQGAASTRPTLANSGATQSESRFVLGGNDTWNQFGQNGYTRNSVSGALPATFGVPTATTGQATLVGMRCV